MHQKIIKNWPIFLIAILCFGLRIIKLEDLFYFTYDESIPAFVGRRLILWQHLPLIGGATPFGFHLGPYFYWFYSIVIFIGNLNPISWGYVSALISVLTTLLIYKVGIIFGGKKVAITAAVFWSFSMLANVYDRHLWALFWGPLFSLIVIFSLYQIIKGKEKFTYVLGFTLALIIHADLSYYVFLVLAVVTWFIFKLPFKKSTIIAIGLIAFSFLPLIVFDIRHNFSNTRPVLNFLKQGRNTPGFNFDKFSSNLMLFPQVSTRLIYRFGDNEISKQYSYCQNYVKEKLSAIPHIATIFSSILLIAFIFARRTPRALSPRMNAREQIHTSEDWEYSARSCKLEKTIPRPFRPRKFIIRSFKAKEKNGWKIASLLILLYFIGIQVYGTILRADIFEHYLTGIFAIILLVFAKITSLLPKKLWLLLLGIFVALNLYKFSLAYNSMGLTAKRQAIEFTMQEVGDRPFSLDSLSTCWKYNGYRYLFTVFGKEPVKSYVDPNFAYLYGTTQVWEKHPQTVVTFVVHDFQPETANFYKRYSLLKSHEISSALFGNIEVIIMDNSSGWFDQLPN